MLSPSLPTRDCLIEISSGIRAHAMLSPLHARRRSFSLLCNRTSDGLTLIATSADGYVSAFTFEEGELGEPSEEQPERPLSDLERVAIASTNLAAAGNATPVTQLTVTHRSSAATQEQHPSSTDTRDAPDSTNNPAATATTSSSSQGHASNSVPSASSGLQASGESDIILLDGPPPAPANGGEQEQKKVKKRAALNFVGPLQ